MSSNKIVFPLFWYSERSDCHFLKALYIYFFLNLNNSPGTLFFLKMKHVLKLLTRAKIL